jgi:hypothetical protein
LLDIGVGGDRAMGGRMAGSGTGICGICRRRLSRAAMPGHLLSCLTALHAPSRPMDAFHLTVECGGGEDVYWMHLLVCASAPLRALDRVLRQVWLECCGHFSMFLIDGARFTVEALHPNDRGMDVHLEEVLTPGRRFAHEYDLGSPTRLTLHVGHRIRVQMPGSAAVGLLARNEPPRFSCDGCGRPACAICTGCDRRLCGPCSDDHACDEALRLPVCNSPRCGVCAYTGHRANEPVGVLTAC